MRLPTRVRRPSRVEPRLVPGTLGTLPTEPPPCALEDGGAEPDESELEAMLVVLLMVAVELE